MKIEDIMLRRLQIVPVTKFDPVNPARNLIMTAQMAILGYQFKNPNEMNDSLFEHYDDFMQQLAASRGGDVEHVPLFAGFPNKTPDPDEYLLRRIFGFFGLAPTEDLFNLDEFGADPVTQMQTLSAYLNGVNQQRERENDSRTAWVDLTLVPYPIAIADAQEYLLSLLYSKSSIKEALYDEVEFMVNLWPELKIDYKKIEFKETRSLLAMIYWRSEQHDRMRHLLLSADDVLRLLSGLAGTGTALTKGSRVPHLNRPNRRVILSILNGMNHLSEDFKRNTRLWKRVGAMLHPGEYSKRYPAVYSMFNTLRNGKLVTYSSRIEASLKDPDIDENRSHAHELVRRMTRRPGDFGRRLYDTLKTLPSHTDMVLSGFASIADQIPLKNLLVMHNHFQTIPMLSHRNIINKNGRLIVMENVEDLKEGVLDSTVGVIRHAIEQQIANQYSSWNARKVYIDPQLDDFQLPLQFRKQSEGFLNIARGTTLDVPVEDGLDTLRLFVYWKDKKEGYESTDLDLSLLVLDADYNAIDQISYSRLRGSSNSGIMHSGDLQSAPHGAAEFIDIPLQRLHPDIAYLMPQINVYAGPSFPDLEEAFTGWMYRDSPTSEYKTFDPKTVVNKINLNSKGGYALPFIYNVHDKKIHYVDIYMRGEQRLNRVENSEQRLEMILPSLIQIQASRPSLGQLAHLHAKARQATLVSTPAEADVVFGVNEGDYIGLQPEKWLAELL